MFLPRLHQREQEALRIRQCLYYRLSLERLLSCSVYLVWSAVPALLVLLVFLVLLGLPVLVCEFAVGRASRKSTARAFHDLEPEGANFHNFSYMSMVSN